MKKSKESKKKNEKRADSKFKILGNKLQDFA